MSAASPGALRVLLTVLVLTATAGCGVLRPDIGAPDYSARPELAASSAERRAEEATVRIRNLGCNAVSTGSGVVVGPRELVTNAHVIAGAEKVEITTWDGRTFEASVEGATVASDLAKVRVDTDLPAAAAFASSDPVEGDQLVVFGFPGGGRFSAERGQLLGYREVDGQYSFVMSNKVRPGNSGGPVFDGSGAVAGVVRALLVEADQGVAIPASVVTAALGSAGTDGQVPGCSEFGTAPTS